MKFTGYCLKTDTQITICIDQLSDIYLQYLKLLL